MLRDSAFLRSVGDIVKTTPRGTLVCKLLFILVCCFVVFDGQHPPASAQQTAPVEMYGLELKSAVQQSRMDQIDDKLNKLDARVSKQWDGINANTLAIAGFQGETRALLGLLGLLQAGSFAFNVKKRRSAD